MHILPINIIKTIITATDADTRLRAGVRESRTRRIGIETKRENEYFAGKSLS